MSQEWIEEDAFPQEPSVGDVSNFGLAGNVRGCEPDGVAHDGWIAVAELRLRGQMRREGHGRDAPRLRANNLTMVVVGGRRMAMVVIGPTVLVQVLRQHRRLAASSLPHQYYYSVCFQRSQYLRPMEGDGQEVVVVLMMKIHGLLSLLLSLLL